MIVKMLFVSLLLVFSKPIHDIQMTVFSFEQHDSSIKLTITFDKEDLIRITNQHEEFILEKAVNYLNSHFVTVFNNEQVAWDFCNYSTNKETITIESNAISPASPITSIKVTNTTFINEIDRQINMIHLKLNDSKRSFRMDINRQIIEANY